MSEMMAWVKPVAEWSAAVLEIIGIGIIVVVAMVALGSGAYRRLRGRPRRDAIQTLRQVLGQGILVGLEFLVAADIIQTVAIDLTFSSVGVLALVVLVRTFLSFTLELELTGRWPWQAERSATAPDAGSAGT